MKRTISDWMIHAAATADPTEVDACVDAGLAEATSCFDFRTLLRGVRELPLVSTARVDAIARRTLELAAVERDVWGFRDVAAVRATRGDTTGARAALEACAEAFLEPGAEVPVRGYQWVLLGQGFAETSADHAGLRRCLEAGRDMARAHDSADDLCSVATEWATRVDRDEGRGLLLEAEQMAGNGSARPWTLANAWHALSDAAAVRRVLGTALREAGSCDDALHVAHAWASHGEPDEVRRALDRAEALATTAAEWLMLGETALDAKAGADRVRRAVERAETLAEDDETRSRVASAYHRWLDDPDAAARVGPRGVRPEALRPRVRALAGWESSAADLFDALRARATVETLTNIAAADYGMDADKHLAALRDFCETGLVPRTLGWEPHEVLALTRWSSGEHVRHLERALSCTLLCLVPSDLDELVTNGPILAESCLELGPDVSHLAERFFAWCAETEPEVDEGDPIGPGDPVALILLFLMRVASAPEDPRLEALAERLTGGLASVRDWIDGSMRSDLWTDLIDRLLVPRRAEHPPTARVLAGLGR